MPQTNVQVGMSAYSLSAAGTCGFSALVSFAVSAPDNNFNGGGKHTLVVTNETSDVPLHIQVRAEINDTVSTIYVPVTLALLSNTQPFGSAQSAVQVNTLMMMLSGVDAIIPLEGIVGKSVQVAVMPASNPASATVVCGIVAVWRL
jgi:hypothetical protein